MGDYDYPAEHLKLENTAVLPYLEVQEATTGNPFFAWEAYRLCREFGATVPDWVLGYLDRAARALLSGEDERRALGFVSSRGRAGRVQEFKRTERNVQLALDVRAILGEDEERFGQAKLTAACKKVAEEHGVGWRTAERAHREVFR